MSCQLKIARVISPQLAFALLRAICTSPCNDITIYEDKVSPSILHISSSSTLA